MRPKIKLVVASCALSTYRLVGDEPTVSEGDRAVAILVMNYIRLRLLPNRQSRAAGKPSDLSIAIDLLAAEPSELSKPPWHRQNDAIGRQKDTCKHAIVALAWQSHAVVGGG